MLSIFKKRKVSFNNYYEKAEHMYFKKILPMEQQVNFGEIYDPPLHSAEFSAKPIVFLVGQYSTGKTTFIKYLLGKSFPGMKIGPEPTTDGFVIVTKGTNEAIIPGTGLVVDQSKPFMGLSKFGTNFLKHIFCAVTNSSILDEITLVDSPGVLAGKQCSRDYEFIPVMKWFGQHADRVLILFDAHKLDISKQFQEAIESFEDEKMKLRIVLNKSDTITPQQLMRVYGALLWSLSKIILVPEPIRIYVGSFSDMPYLSMENSILFDKEKTDLLDDLGSLPRNSIIRKINLLLTRSKKLQILLAILSSAGTLRTKNLPMDQIYSDVSLRYGFAISDFPDEEVMVEYVKKFSSRNMKLFTKKQCRKATNELLEAFLPILNDFETDNDSSSALKGGVFSSINQSHSMFEDEEGINAGRHSDTWIIEKPKLEKYDQLFENMSKNKMITPRGAKDYMLETHLPNNVLNKLWKLADVDKDDKLNEFEFAIFAYLIDLKCQGYDIPAKLPSHLYPPDITANSRDSSSSLSELSDLYE